MEKHYTSEKNVQMLLSLMKAHGVRKIVASPGTTNIAFVGSVQNDPYFEVYSSVDERSAAYIACGLAAESGEPVALSCTGATASRNYLSGLTEAYYRKLPILAITSTQHIGRIGQNVAQVIDRTQMQNDVAKMSIQLPSIHDKEDEWAYGVMINTALLELTRNGGGPVHINLTTTYSKDFSIKELPNVPVIKRICSFNDFPELVGKRIGIWVGAHKRWTEKEKNVLEAFCAKYGAVVFCDHTSNYNGFYAIHSSLVCCQKQYTVPCKKLDVLIDIGDVSGATMSLQPNEVWRVNVDGEVRDTYRKLKYVFQMEEQFFFESYAKLDDKCNTKKDAQYLQAWKELCEEVENEVPEVPFSNIWVAKNLSKEMPKDSIIHFGILNSLRSWDFFNISNSYEGYSNTGGFGIDGCMSALIGGALAQPEKLHFGFIGDFAFFYDMNSIGNRHVTNNIRILVVNNGRGQEFKNYNHPGAAFGDDADAYISAAGHYGNQSRVLLKHYAEDIGFQYISAESKSEFKENMGLFLSSSVDDRPIIFEVFTKSEDENEALQMIHSIRVDSAGMAKKIAKNILGENTVKSLKNLVSK